jgi:hypothetical protein
VEHGRAYAELLHGTLEELAQFVVAYLAYVSRGHAQDGSAGDGVRRRSAGNIFYAHLAEGFPDPVSGFHIDELHAPERKVVLLEERIIRQYGQDIGEGVAYFKD